MNSSPRGTLQPPTQSPNQSATPHAVTRFLLGHSLFITVVFLVRLVIQTFPHPVQAYTLSAYATAPPTIIPSASPVSTPAPSDTPLPSPVALQDPQTIKAYIYTIFGKNASTAYAIALAESGRSDHGRWYFNTTAIHRSDYELSIGVFQVNLKSKYAKVHYDRIPGSTIDEKITWLQNPYNNTLFAYWIYSNSGFEPWSVYTKGNYLAFLN